jgi:hypothetical protein
MQIYFLCVDVMFFPFLLLIASENMSIQILFRLNKYVTPAEEKKQQLISWTFLLNFFSLKCFMFNAILTVSIEISHMT